MPTEATETATEQAYIRLAVQQSGKVRTETLMGREFRVVPAVLVQSQVLHNNLGRTFLPEDEITQALADMANHAPVLSDHPKRRGQPATGRDPEILNQLGVGFLFAGRAEAGKIRADVWLDPSRVSEVPDLGVVLEKLDRSETVELSTGLPLRLIEETPGAFNGREYDRVIRIAGFDHLAVFAEKTGACSVTDGCGLGINHDGTCEFVPLDEESSRDEPVPAINVDPDDDARTILQRILAVAQKFTKSGGSDPITGPAEPTQPATNAGDLPPEEGSTMNREQMIAHLAENGRDKDVLNKLSDCDLKALMGAGKPADNPEPNDPDERSWQQKALAYRGELDTLKAQSANALKEEAKERVDLLDDLLYKGRSVEWSENELKAMDLPMLRKVHRQVTNVADYSGQGGPRSISAPSGGFTWYKPRVDRLRETEEVN